MKVSRRGHGERGEAGRTKKDILLLLLNNKDGLGSTKIHKKLKKHIRGIKERLSELKKERLIKSQIKDGLAIYTVGGVLSVVKRYPVLYNDIDFGPYEPGQIRGAIRLISDNEAERHMLNNPYTIHPQLNFVELLIHCNKKTKKEIIKFLENAISNLRKNQNSPVYFGKSVTFFKNKVIDKKSNLFEYIKRPVQRSQKKLPLLMEALDKKLIEFGMGEIKFGEYLTLLDNVYDIKTIRELDKETVNRILKRSEVKKEKNKLTTL